MATETIRIRCDEAKPGDFVTSSKLTVLRLGPVHTAPILGIRQKVLKVKVRDRHGAEKWRSWRPDTRIRVERDAEGVAR